MGDIELTDEEVLDAFVFLRVFEGLALEDQQGLAVAGHEIWRFELVHRFEVLHAELHHIEHMRIKNTPKHQIVRSFFLV